MSKIQRMPKGQLFILLPKALAEGLTWTAGTEVTIRIGGKDKIEVVRI